MNIEEVSRVDGALIAVAITLLVLTAGVLFHVWTTSRSKGIKIMSNKEAAQLRHLAAVSALTPSITDTIEELVHKGAITPDEGQRWYKKLGSQGLPDLLPGRGDLKRSIKLRLKVYNWEPAKIPGELPAQAVGPQFGDKLKKFKKPVGKTTVTA